MIEGRRHVGLLIARLDHLGFGPIGGASRWGHRCEVNEALTEDEQAACTAARRLRPGWPPPQCSSGDSSVPLMRGSNNRPRHGSPTGPAVARASARSYGVLVGFRLG